MKKLPSLSLLRKQIDNKDVRQALTFLLANRAFFATFADVEELIFSMPDPPLPPPWPGVEHHFSALKGRVASVLYSYGIFVGSSVLDDLLFAGLREVKVHDPIMFALEGIRDTGIHRPGMIVYPLHSFGLIGVGFLEHYFKVRGDITIAEAGISVRAQTNSQDASTAFLERTADQFGIRERLPRDLLTHYIRSRSLNWFTHNPLLVVKIRSFSGSYSETQALFLIKLKLASSVLFMMKSFEEGLVKSGDRFGSSARVNNFQTLDIKHYLLFEQRPGRRRELRARCIPMNASRAELAELSAATVELDPRVWRHRMPIVLQMIAALGEIERGYLRYCLVRSKKKDARAEFYRKLFECLSYFRRSFRPAANPGERVVNLAVAFEMLLTDRWGSGVAERLHKRLRTVLTDVRGIRRFLRSLDDLWVCRCEVVHRGLAKTSVDLAIAQRAFVHAFIWVAMRARGVPRIEGEPVRMLLAE